MENEQKNISGQTVLEVLVALTLVVFFLSGVVIVELYAIRNVEYGQNKSMATKLARQQLERARVVRDSAGIDALSVCSSDCYIDAFLTPALISPTGIYGQSLVLSSSSDCPIPPLVTPIPTIFKMISTVSWSQGVPVTPAAEVELSSCISDWR